MREEVKGLLRIAYEAYLRWQGGEGDPSTFLDWVRDELSDLAKTGPSFGGSPVGEERTGLECEDCGKKQKRLQVHRDDDKALLVRIMYSIPAAKVRDEVRGLCSILRSFADGF